ncbi:MAG: phosphotransferase family protein [Janthinobacterium lividum]
MSDNIRPTEAFALQVATDTTGDTPLSARRFTTGSSHYVYEVSFSDRPSIVVRVGQHQARHGMQGAVSLSNLLKPLGVPLPAIMAANVEADLPWLVLERLPGTDLGGVIEHLTEEQLETLAQNIALAQTLTSKTATANKYGYATAPDLAPYAIWSQVLDTSLNRSRQRIASAGLFETVLVDDLQTIVSTRRSKLDQIASVPFLHDTTTKNVIIASNGVLSGIVDVDDLCFGDPRYPAALTLAVLLAYGGPVEYVSAWLRHAGQSDDQTFRLYVSLFLLDLMAEHGQVFNGNERQSDPETRMALRTAYRDSLQLVLG